MAGGDGVPSVASSKNQDSPSVAEDEKPSVASSTVLGMQVAGALKVSLQGEMNNHGARCEDRGDNEGERGIGC
jgi:hypothetical protein